jgi:hypothetical protein
MQTILAILKMAGGWRPGLHLEIDDPPHMELVIEAMDEFGSLGLPIISVCHYGEQNGDLMRDPEVCFDLGFAEEPHLDPGTGGTTTLPSSSGAALLCAATMSILSPCMNNTSALPGHGAMICACRASWKPSRDSRPRALNPFRSGADTGQRVRSMGVFRSGACRLFAHDNHPWPRSGRTCGCLP